MFRVHSDDFLATSRVPPLEYNIPWLVIGMKLKTDPKSVSPSTASYTTARSRSRSRSRSHSRSHSRSPPIAFDDIYENNDLPFQQKKPMKQKKSKKKVPHYFSLDDVYKLPATAVDGNNPMLRKKTKTTFNLSKLFKKKGKKTLKKGGN